VGIDSQILEMTGTIIDLFIRPDCSITLFERLFVGISFAILRR